jgi:hypothetical protein
MSRIFAANLPDPGSRDNPARELRVTQPGNAGGAAVCIPGPNPRSAARSHHPDTEDIDGFEEFAFNAIPDDLVGFSARFGDSRGIVEAPNLSAGTPSPIGVG